MSTTATKYTDKVRRAVFASPLAPSVRRLNTESKLPWQLAMRLYHWPQFQNMLWYNVFNRRAREAYAATSITTSPTQDSILSSLERDGCAITSFDEVLPQLYFKDYSKAAENLIRSPDLTTEIRSAEERAQAADPGKDSKYYVVKALKKPVVDLEDPWFRLALSDELLGIAARYFGMLCRLLYLDIWYNVPYPGPAIHSQLWHRDPEDKKILKVFLYLRDVNENNGPLSFVAGSQENGPFANICRRRPPYGRRVPDHDVDSRLSSHVRTFTGSPGTLVLCDTTGIHRGGLARDRARLLFTAVYTSDAVNSRSLSSKNWVLGDSSAIGLSGPARYAIGSHRK